MTLIFDSRPRRVARARSHSLMRPAKANSTVAKPSSSGISNVEQRAPASAAAAPRRQPRRCTDASTSPTKARLNGGSCERSVKRGEHVAGADQRSEIDAVATPAAAPTASSTGKVIDRGAADQRRHQPTAMPAQEQRWWEVHYPVVPAEPARPDHTPAIDKARRIGPRLRGRRLRRTPGCRSARGRGSARGCRGCPRRCSPFRGCTSRA